MSHLQLVHICILPLPRRPCPQCLPGLPTPRLDPSTQRHFSQRLRRRLPSTPQYHEPPSMMDPPSSSATGQTVTESIHLGEPACLLDFRGTFLDGG